MADELIVLVTCPASGADKVARPLVEERLAACVNIVPGVSSIFHWQGELCQEPEELLVIKSNRTCWERLQRRVKELHAYDTPEIICFKVEDGYKPYLNWLNSALGDSE